MEHGARRSSSSSGGGNTATFVAHDRGRRPATVHSACDVPKHAICEFQTSQIPPGATDLSRNILDKAWLPLGNERPSVHLTAPKDARLSASYGAPPRRAAGQTPPAAPCRPSQALRCGNSGGTCAAVPRACRVNDYRTSLEAAPVAWKWRAAARVWSGARLDDGSFPRRRSFYHKRTGLSSGKGASRGLAA